MATSISSKQFVPSAPRLSIIGARRGSFTFQAVVLPAGAVRLPPLRLALTAVPIANHRRFRAASPEKAVGPTFIDGTSVLTSLK